MTVDEIFTSESEHLYFRLIAARNALNAANDSDTIQVLNEILDETLNNIDRIGTEEEIAAAEEIVVRKSNKTVKDYLSCQKFNLIATAVMFVTAVGAALALLMIIVGSSDKVKPIVAVVIVAAGIIGMAFFVSRYMKKRMDQAREELKGKTVIGVKINTGVATTSTKTTTSSSASTKKEKSSSSSSSSASVGKTKVVRNYFGVIKVVLLLAIIAVLGFTVYTKRTQIVDSIKIIMYNIGLYDPAPAADSERFAEIRTTLINKRKGIYYNKAEDLFANEQYAEAAEMYNQCYGYKDDVEAKILLSNNCKYYVEAEDAVADSMIKARIALNNIKLPFDNVTIRGKKIKNVEVLLGQYTKYLDYVGIYSAGEETFNITDFSKDKNFNVFVVEKKLGKLELSNATDMEDYDYVVQKKSGEDVIKWYIAQDNVLKVTAEGEIKLRK